MMKKIRVRFMYDSEITIDIFGTSVSPVRRSCIALKDLGRCFNVE